MKIFIYLGTLFQIYPIVLLILVTLVVIGSNNQIVFSQADNPRYTGIIDKNMSVTDVDIAWWKVVMETPDDENHPSNDPDGSACSAGNLHENVWFLFGAFQGNVNRECEIPAGKIIYFAHGYECNTIENPREQTYEDLLKCATTGADREIIPGKYKIIFDKKELTDLFDYKVISPPFDINLPKDAVFKLPEGKALAAAVTYYVFFKPLDPGIHTLNVSTVSTPDITDPTNPLKLVNVWNVNYELIVK